ncbi:MAG: DUF3999 family protein [Lysobacteraceae bacterium]
MRRKLSTQAFWLVLLVTLSDFGLAAEFAWQRAVSVPAGGSGLYRLALDEQAYRRLYQNDLSDVALFDGLGQPLPLAVLRAPLSASPMPAWREIDWFILPNSATPESDLDVSVFVERTDDGRLRRLETRLQGASTVTDAPTSAPGGDWLLDLGEHAEATAVRVSMPETLEFDWRLRVHGSDDLVHWRWLTDAGLLRLKRDGLRLEQMRVSLPLAPPRYLRLQRADREPLPEPLKVEAEHCVCAGDQIAQTHALAPRSVDAKDVLAGQFEYVSAGPFPADAIVLDLQGSADLATVRVFSRAGSGSEWRWRGEGTVFELGAASDTRVAIQQGARDREWRIETMPPLMRAPGLRLSYVPDQYLLMPGANAEVMLAIGSAEARLSEYPLDVALAEVRAREGKDWLPPMLPLGDESIRAGEAALRPVDPPLPWKRWLLWGVLGVGAVSVLLMVRQLLRVDGEAPKT